jgi:Sec-independent protein translocase protein TatA
LKIASPQKPFNVLISALTVIPMYWENMGWMFGGAKQRCSQFQQQALEEASKDKATEETEGKTEETPSSTEAPSKPKEEKEVKEETA